jgi:hypothetical protein
MDEAIALMKHYPIDRHFGAVGSKLTPISFRMALKWDDFATDAPHGPTPDIKG